MKYNIRGCFFTACALVMGIVEPCLAIVTQQTHTTETTKITVTFPNGEVLQEDSGNWPDALNYGRVKSAYELNDGTIMVNNVGDVVSLNLTPEQKQSLLDGSVDGYVVVTPSNKFMAIPRESIIEASLELKARREAQNALNDEL